MNVVYTSPSTFTNCKWFIKIKIAELDSKKKKRA